MNIVITGASDGIGEAMARAFSKEHTVIMLARNEEKLSKIAKETGAAFMACDVREAAQVKQAFEDIIKKHSKIDVLVNNAGVIVNGDVTETEDEIIKNVIDTNTLGAIYAAKYALVGMKQAKDGLIINIVSQAGVTARANRSIYNASKWALTGFTRAIQEEASEYGVRVTGFYPGTIYTDLFKKAGLVIDTSALTPEDIVKAITFIIDQPATAFIPHFEIKPKYLGK